MRDLLKRLFQHAFYFRDMHRFTIALTKGGVSMQHRKVDLEQPTTWEFSGFSQNGEDGIIDVLRSNLLKSNRYCIEIGAADGMENNTSWLIMLQGYTALLIEGSSILSRRLRRTIMQYTLGSEHRNMFVTKDNVASLRDVTVHMDPDLLSVDIDGMDYYVVKAMLDHGYRPKIVVVEYNSSYGPDRSITIPYKEDFVYTQAHPSHLYYGVSVMGWRTLFNHYGYRFVTVERNGANAFFVDPAHFDARFLDRIQPLEFAENVFQLRMFKAAHEQQFELIKNEAYVEIA